MEVQRSFLGEVTKYSFLKMVNRYVDFDMMEMFGKEVNPEDYKSVTGNEYKVIQDWMDKAPFEFRMYGSAEELSNQVVMYTCFLGNHTFFELDPSEAYFSCPQYCQSSEEANLCKQDVLVELFLHSSDYLPYDDYNENGLKHAIDVLMMRDAIEKLEVGIETVKYKLQKFREIERKFFPQGDDILPDVPFDPPTDTQENFEYYFIDQLRQIISGNRMDGDFKRVRHFLKRNLRQTPFLSNLNRYKHFLQIAAFVKNCLATISQEYPDYLLPTLKNHPEQVVTGRHYYEGESSFFILKDFMEEASLIGIHLHPLDMLRDPRKQYFTSFIPRTKHRATPIKVNTGGFCILAEDAFLEFLRPLLFQLKLFQRLRPDEWQKLEAFFEKNVLPLLKLSEEERTVRGVVYQAEKHFIRLDVMENLKKRTFEYFSDVSKRPAKEIRSVKRDGFKLADLRNELKNLSLLEIFPDIIDFAEVAFEMVSNASNFPVLRTCDMFEAVELCQVASLLRRIPALAQFFCDQKACISVVHPCVENCRGDYSDEKKKVNNIRKQRENVEKETETATTTNKNRKTKKKSKAKKVEKEEIPPFQSIGVNTEESGHCKKCFRASQMCDEAKKELKLSRNQVEKLTKKLREAEKKAVCSEELEEVSKKLKMMENYTNGMEEQLQKQFEKVKEMKERMERLESLFAEQQGGLHSLETSPNTQPSTSSELATTPPESPSATSTELSQEMKEILFDLQSRRNGLLNENIVSHAADKAHKLMFKSTDPKIKKNAKFELTKFNQQFEVYMKALESNIQKIQSNVNITSSEVSKLPDFPKFSDGFEKAFELLAWKSETPQDGAKQNAEIADKECIICLEDMKEEETMKCQNCRRRYHSACLKAWLKKKTTCPTCKRTLLDPNEFPPIN